jgi:hypothetical protein
MGKRPQEWGRSGIAFAGFMAEHPAMHDRSGEMGGIKLRSFFSTLFLLILFYLLSIGPVAWVSWKLGVTPWYESALANVYWPLLKLRDLGLEVPFQWYINVWVPEKESKSIPWIYPQPKTRKSGR